MKQKQVFGTIFLLFTLFLMVLPFLVTFNDFLTRILQQFQLYVYMQQLIVPIEVQAVRFMLSPLHMDILAHPDGFTVNGAYVGMTWNCIGWQSILLLGITLLVSLRSSSYTLLSQIETVVIGVLGTFLVNLLRLCFIVVILAISRPLFAVVYHDYLAAVVTIIWLFFFWWFAYKFVLEEKQI